MEPLILVCLFVWCFLNQVLHVFNALKFYLELISYLQGNYESQEIESTYALHPAPSVSASHINDAVINDTVERNSK